ncbi:MAG: AMIN domain-containing protein [Candidatus Aminicenantes bacterium]
MRKEHHKTIAAVTALVLLPVMMTAQTESTTELNDIRVSPLENRLQIKLEVPAPINYESFSLFNPNRLVIDLLNMENFFCPPEIPVNDFGVMQIRTGKNQPDVIRVVFDLEETAPAYTIEEKEDGIYVFFEPAAAPVLEDIPAEETAEKKSEAEQEAVPPPVKKEEKPAEEKKAPVEIQKPAGMERVFRPKTLAVSAAGGAYMVQDSNFQEVYGKSAFSFGGDLTYYFPLGAFENIGASLDIRYISSAGQTTYTQEDVELTLIPFSLSLVYQRLFGDIGPYAGIGLDYINYKETYPETFIISETSGSALGYHLVLGSTFHFIPSMGLKAFFKLHSAKKTINEMEVNFGGAELGLGLFYKFNF